MWECMLQARAGWQSVEKCGQQCGGTHRPGARDRGAPADGSGKGFSEQDLIYADQEFYSGDASRHDRTHQGLGLAIAKKFLKEQGGMLCFYNHAESGAEVVCRIKTEKT